MWRLSQNSVQHPSSGHPSSYEKGHRLPVQTEAKLRSERGERLSLLKPGPTCSNLGSPAQTRTHLLIAPWISHHLLHRENLSSSQAQKSQDLDTF